MKFGMIAIAVCLIGCAAEPGPIKRQMVGLLEKFDRWDYNGDGYLSRSELKPARALSHFTEDEIMEFYDQNNDGRISRVEARGALARVDKARDVAEEVEQGS